MDNNLAWMYELIKYSKFKGKSLRREYFKQIGADVQLYPGVESWFENVNAYAAEHGIEVEHYVISSGLREIIEGSEIAGEFKKIYASSYLYNADDVAVWPAQAVNYTNKTQFIFKINKGIREVSDRVRVNEFVPTDERPVPFERMIYFGDGETDVPCMRTVKSNGGHSFAVYGNDKKRALAQQLLSEGRVNFACAADYTENSEMMVIVKRVLDKIKADYTLTQHEVENRDTLNMFAALGDSLE